MRTWRFETNLGRNDAAGDDQNVLGPLLLERLDERGNQCVVAGSLRAHADAVHVGVDGLASSLLGRREERADVHVEAHIRVARRDHLGAAVVAILTHLGHEHTRPSTKSLRERLNLRNHTRVLLLGVLVVLVRRLVRSRHDRTL